MLIDPTPLDIAEKMMTEMPQVMCQIEHRFTPGLYIREITIPAGTLLTSAEHRTEHPFVISKGKIDVISENEGAVTYEAPFTGVTQPGTRRMLFAHTDTVWTTFHVTHKTDVEQIADEILDPPSNPLLTDSGIQEDQQWRQSLPQPINE